MRLRFNPAMTERHTRSPMVNFYVEPDLWEVQPVFAVPVLPGETMTSLTLQSRVVTPPVKSRTVGWWLEYYIFYVPFRQMPDAANLIAMFVDPTVTLAPSAASARDYYSGLGYNFIAQCLQVVVQEWFRREGELWSNFVIRATRPAASHGIDRLDDSLIDTTVLPDGGAIAGMNVDDLDRARAIVEYRRMLKTMGSDGGQIDYEEVLASYGASIRKAAARDRPELLRYIRDWTYPVNTVEPTTGVPTTAASWAISDRADKNRAFTEPGFVFGVQCVRPKIYFSNQTNHGATMLDRAQRWLPPNVDEAGMERSLAEFTTLQGPFGKPAGGFTNGYWLDVRDLLNYGDQHLDGTAANCNAVALPAAGAINTRYASQAIADSLKVTAGALVQCDGNVTLRIKTRSVDPS